MTNALLVILIIILGIIAFVGLVILAIYSKFRQIAREAGFGDMKNVMKEIKTSSDAIRYNKKSISGMTRLLEPTIQADFPKFNKNELYSMCERDLRTIFKCLENKSSENLNEIPLLKESILKQISDLSEDKIDINYSGILFHDFAIRNYEKKNGAATVDIAVALQYDYQEFKDNKLIKDNKTVQKRYSCKYVYIYDQSLFGKHEHVFGIHCPNCGAAVVDLGEKQCRYCQAHIEDINLSSWQLSSYKEY